MPKLAALFLLLLLAPRVARAQQPAPLQLVPKFPLTKSGLELERRTHPGAFLDVLGRKSAVLGYEHRQFEAWVYPLQVLDQFEVSFRLEGYPLDARIRSVKANGRSEKFSVSREGDVQRVEVACDVSDEITQVDIYCDEGSDVYVPFDAPSQGARSEALRVLRSHAEPGALRLLLEGRGRRSYTLYLKTPFVARGGEGFGVMGGNDYRLTVEFDSSTDDYVRRELVIPLKKR
jgi:hypothetical protein